jgi:hypothetical protein
MNLDFPEILPEALFFSNSDDPFVIILKEIENEDSYDDNDSQESYSLIESDDEDEDYYEYEDQNGIQDQVDDVLERIDWNDDSDDEDEL